MNDLETIDEFLRTQSTLTLATISDDGTAYATPLFYIYVVGDDRQLYWLSSESSHHSSHVVTRPEVSVAIYAQTDEWENVRGIQMWGRAQIVHDSNERKAITRAYITRFHLGNLFRVAILASKMYRFNPVRVRYLDNSKHFGYRREISLR